jgi:TonB family protein
MEILRLSLWRPSLGAAPGTQQGNCSDASPRLLLIPAPPLPARHFLEGLGVDFVLIGLALASLFSKSPVPGATFNPAQPYKKPIPITFYDPSPATKRPLDVSLSGVKRHEGRRLSLPLESALPVGAPVLSPPPTVIETRAGGVPQIPEEGLPFLPRSAQAILQARTGSPEAPAPPVPILDPSPHHGAAFPQHGPNVGSDPLGSGGSTERLFGHDSGTENAGGAPPDLSAKPPRAVQRYQMQLQREAFTKPEISVMPKPVYPPAALAARIEGDVILQVTFDKSGRVIFRGFIRQLQNAEMNSVARETVERIKFVPATRNGVPVDSDSVITVLFRLTQLNDMTATF